MHIFPPVSRDEDGIIVCFTISVTETLTSGQPYVGKSCKAVAMGTFRLQESTPEPMEKYCLQSFFDDSRGCSFPALA